MKNFSSNQKYEQKPGLNNDRKGYKSNSKKPRGQSKMRDYDTNERDYYKKEGSNDVSWYSLNTTMLKDAASIPFNRPLGMVLPSDKINNTSVANATRYDGSNDIPDVIMLNSIPGIMRLNFMPTIGSSLEETSAVNVASKRMYEFIRTKISGNTRNYEPADLMLAVLAMDQIFMVWTHLMRVYGVHKHFDQTNRYLGDNLVRALGVDPTSLRSGLADFRLSLNYIGAQMNQFFVPSDLPLFKRHMWLASNLFYDDPIQKSQVIAFVPEYAWEYSPKTSTKGGELVPLLLKAENDSQPQNIKEWVSKLQQMVNSVSLDTDISLIYADIYKAYGENGVYKVPQLPEDFAMAPVYNKEVLDQVSNATPIGSPLIQKKPADKYFCSIAQEDALIKSRMYVFCGTATAPNLQRDIWLNYYDGEPSPERNMVASRLTLNSAIKMSDATAAWITQHGSEFITTVDIFAMGYDEDPQAPKGNFLAKCYNNSNALATGITSHDYQVLFGCFTNKPMLFVGDLISGRYLDSRNLGNIGALNVETLNGMHRTAILSQFNIPADAQLG